MPEPVQLIALATATLLLVGRTWRRGYEARTAVGVGALAAAAVVTRTAGLVLVAVIAIGGLGPLWTRGAVARKYVGWLEQALAAGAVVVLACLAAKNWW